jgi:hypothetical protein
MPWIIESARSIQSSCSPLNFDQSGSCGAGGGAGSRPASLAFETSTHSRRIGAIIQGEILDVGGLFEEALRCDGGALGRDVFELGDARQNVNICQQSGGRLTVSFEASSAICLRRALALGELLREPLVPGIAQDQAARPRRAGFGAPRPCPRAGLRPSPERLLLAMMDRSTAPFPCQKG